MRAAGSGRDGVWTLQSRGVYGLLVGVLGTWALTWEMCLAFAALAAMGYEPNRMRSSAWAATTATVPLLGLSLWFHHWSGVAPNVAALIFWWSADRVVRQGAPRNRLDYLIRAVAKRLDALAEQHAWAVVVVVTTAYPGLVALLFRVDPGLRHVLDAFVRSGFNLGHLSGDARFYGFISIAGLIYLAKRDVRDRQARLHLYLMGLVPPVVWGLAASSLPADFATAALLAAVFFTLAVLGDVFVNADPTHPTHR